MLLNTKVFYEISEKLYKAAAPEGAQGAPDFGAGFGGGAADAGASGEDGYYDASYTDV